MLLFCIKDRAEHSSAESQFMVFSQTWSWARNNCCTKLLPLHGLQAHTSWQLPSCEHHHPMLSPTADTALQAATSCWQQEDSAFQTLSAAATRSSHRIDTWELLSKSPDLVTGWISGACLGSYVQFQAPCGLPARGTGWLVCRLSLCPYLMVIPTAAACRYRVFHMGIIIINKYKLNSAFL